MEEDFTRNGAKRSTFDAVVGGISDTKSMCFHLCKYIQAMCIVLLSHVPRSCVRWDRFKLARVVCVEADFHFLKVFLLSDDNEVKRCEGAKVQLPDH